MDYTWSSSEILKFISTVSKYNLVNETTNCFNHLYKQVLEEIGLADKVSIESAVSLWDWLVTKFKELSHISLQGHHGIPLQWEYFNAMQEAFLSQPTAVVDLETPTSITLEPVHEETVEDEAARLENVFSESNLIGIQKSLNQEHNVGAEEDEESEVEEDSSSGEGEEFEQNGDLPPNSGTSLIDSVWTEDVLFQFIELRRQKEPEFLEVNPKIMFGRMLNYLGITLRTNGVMAHKKWKMLVQKYFKIKSNMDETEDNSLDAFSKGSSNTDQGKCGTSWPFFSAMDLAMQDIIKTSPDGGVRSRKSRNFTWTAEATKKFIRLRTEKHSLICKKGHRYVYQEILKELEIADKVSVFHARRHWTYLMKRYEDEKLAGGKRTWAFMRDMGTAIAKLGGTTHANNLKSRASPEFLWPNDLTKKFIKLRTERHANFVNSGIQQTYTAILEELGVAHILTANHLRKKWNYLVAKYKILLCSSGRQGEVPAPHTWSFFDDMKEAVDALPAESAYKVFRSNAENIWSKEVLVRFIQLKGKKMREEANSNKLSSAIFGEIIEELGLSNQVTAVQARKKWNYLYTKYLDLCLPDVDYFTRNSWPFFYLMKQVVGELPLSEIMKKKSIGLEIEIENDDNPGRSRPYCCFLCGKTGADLNDFFMFEAKQRLLATNKTVIEILSDLMDRKLFQSESTFLCSPCTNLVNEADSVMSQHNNLKARSRDLYSKKASTAVPKNDANVYIQEKTPVRDEQELPHSSSTITTYSKRGRKRTSRVFNTEVELDIKAESEFENDDFVDDSEGEINKRSTLSNRGRRGKRKRGRPAKRTTLIGRGLDGQYPSSNKRKSLPSKGAKVYRCLECKAEFKTYASIVAHRKEKHTVFDKTELQVEETVLENGVITYFNKDKANKLTKSHDCRHCDKTFLRKDDLWYHEELAHTQGKGRAKTTFKDRSYECEECGEKFLFKYKLKFHINSRHLNDAGVSADDFTCGECGYKLGNLPSLTFHMRKHHKKSLSCRKDPEYLCSDCGFLATSNRKLKEHQLQHCSPTVKPKVQCEICGKTVLKVSLKMHKLKMHYEFKEQCDRCGERYATKTELLRHINVVHLGILIYKCEQCGEKFPKSDALRYHHIKFHENPSFFCQICGKSFRRLGELNTHVKRCHSDKRKAEQCRYCGKEYFDRSGLRNHLISKHNVPAKNTYSEAYLRKKRIDGLPLAKIQETEKNNCVQVANNGFNQESTRHFVQPHHQIPQQVNQPDINHSHLIPHHTSIGLDPLDEAAEAARNLNAAYLESQNPNQEPHNTIHEDESSLVVTEINAAPQLEQTPMMQPLTVPQGTIIHHSQVTHLQPQQSSMVVQQPLQHPIHPSNMRVNVIYQMNVQLHPDQNNLNM